MLHSQVETSNFMTKHLYMNCTPKTYTLSFSTKKSLKVPNYHTLMFVHARKSRVVRATSGPQRPLAPPDGRPRLPQPRPLPTASPGSRSPRPLP